MAAKLVNGVQYTVSTESEPSRDALKVIAIVADRVHTCTGVMSWSEMKSAFYGFKVLSSDHPEGIKLLNRLNERVKETLGGNTVPSISLPFSMLHNMQAMNSKSITSFLQTGHTTFLGLCVI